MEIFRTDDFYVLLCGESSLWVSKKSGEIDVKPAWMLANGQDPECMGIFFGYIGQIKCSVIEDYILLVKESILVGDLPSGHAVHKIKSIAMLNPTFEGFQDLGLKPCSKHHRAAYDTHELSPNNSAISKTWSSLKTATSNIKASSQLSTSQNQNRKEAKEREKYQRRIKEELQRIFTDTDSFYFCPAGGDITNTVYRQYLFSEANKNSSDSIPLDQIDDRFFWNKHMLQDVININSPLAKVWAMPIIQGYIEIAQCKIFFKENGKYELFTISLISRRSRHRVGTRYKRRGLDEHGHCANYVETEQILQYKSHFVSFVQIRGSIPLYWSQQGYKYRPPPQLHKNYDENQIAFEKHLVEEIDRYGPVVIVNLVERTGKEAVVGDAYADHVCTFNSDRVTYVTFDIHHYCRAMKFENVSILIDEIQDEISKMNYCWVDNQGLISKQKGVFRVNCIDCLDRTNLVQTSIAREVLMSQLVKLGLLSPETPHNLLTVTQQMWANNGDVISKQYAGTSALKGDITRTGNRKISGLMKDGMNSANRYFRSYYADHYTQLCLDIMHGQPLESNNVLITLVDSVASPVVNQILPSNYPVTLSAQHYVFNNELRITEFLFLLSRYYLSRFKDSTRQATLDIMLGNSIEENVMQQKDSSEDEDDSSVNEEENLATIEHIKQVIDDVKKLLIEDPSSVIAAWALLNADYQNESSSNHTEMDTILVLTRSSCFIADYDNDLDKVVKFQEIEFKHLKSLELHVQSDNTSPSSSSSQSSSQKICSKNVPVLILHYFLNLNQPNYVLQYAFKSTNLRFFNNIAVTIKNDEEKCESLKAIGETIQVAYEVCCSGELEFNVRVVQRKGSVFLPGAPDVQFPSLKNVGSKALSNVSQQFSKFNKFGQNFRFNKNKGNDKSITGTDIELPDTTSQEAFLPTAGIVLSNTHIDTSLTIGHLKREDHHKTGTPKIVVDDGPSSETESTSCAKFEKSHSSSQVDNLINVSSVPRSSSNKDLSLNLASVVHDDDTFQSLKSGFASATNALVSPMSPFSRLAKGVQNLSNNLDPRRLKNNDRIQETFQITENGKVKEKWLATGCSSKLIAL